MGRNVCIGRFFSIQHQRYKRAISKMSVFRRREALVTMRNQKVISAFKTKYKNLASDLRSLDVWCVSNTAYSTHKIGYDDEDIPLSLTTTGIPALRTLISRYPATGRLNVLKYHCESTVPGIVGSMEMWSLGGSIPNRAELRKIVESPIKVRRCLEREQS